MLYSYVYMVPRFLQEEVMMDAKGFTEKYKEIYKDLYRFALCMMRHSYDAEDAVMEAVLSGYENVHKLRKEEAFKSWMFQILANVCRKKLRQKSKEQQNRIEVPEERQPEMVAEEIDHGLRMDVQKAFFVLSEEEQMIVALSVFGGYKSEEIAETMKLKSGTVRSKLSRALDKMECILR